MRQRLATYLNSLTYRTDGSAGDNYHLWYYNTGVYLNTKWMGVSTYKSPADMWNYQEILHFLQPALVVEFGTFHGGSALLFAAVMRQIGNRFRVPSVDVNHSLIHDSVRLDPDIELMKSSSSDAQVADRIAHLKETYPGPVFSILDSDHRKPHVLAEMKLLKPLLSPGDYMVVEDSNLNGHPVLPHWGEGPYEAVEEYFREFPTDYTRDTARSRKFGFTFVPDGFLIRN